MEHYQTAGKVIEVQLIFKKIQEIKTIKILDMVKSDCTAILSS